MSKFKVGDRVKVIASEAELRDVRCDTSLVKSGETYVIEGATEGCIAIFKHQPAYVRTDMVELAPSFTINRGDYIDSREFTSEECERFCELAVECGFESGEWMDYFHSFENLGVGTLRGSIYSCDGTAGAADDLLINITTQFREFLDKEKSMNKFTKEKVTIELTKEQAELVKKQLGNKQ